MRFGVENVLVQREERLIREEEIQVLERLREEETASGRNKGVSQQIASKRKEKTKNKTKQNELKKTNTHLGIESCNGTSGSNVFFTAAYADSVRVYFSIASNAAHPRSRQTSSPVVRHMMKKDSIVCSCKANESHQLISHLAISVKKKRERKKKGENETGREHTYLRP